MIRGMTLEELLEEIKELVRVQGDHVWSLPVWADTDEGYRFPITKLTINSRREGNRIFLSDRT